MKSNVLICSQIYLLLVRINNILNYEICYMQSALSAEARAQSRDLVDVVINELLHSIKVGNFLTS